MNREDRTKITLSKIRKTRIFFGTSRPLDPKELRLLLISDSEGYRDIINQASDYVDNHPKEFND